MDIKTLMEAIGKEALARGCDFSWEDKGGPLEVWLWMDDAEYNYEVVDVVELLARVKEATPQIVNPDVFWSPIAEDPDVFWAETEVDMDYIADAFWSVMNEYYQV